MNELRHLRRKAPRKTRGFAWARLHDEQRGRVTWRLTRGDVAGKLYLEARTFHADELRSCIAHELRLARNRLRDTVDKVSLQQLGVEA